MKRLLALVLLAAVVACSTPSGSPSLDPPAPSESSVSTESVSPFRQRIERARAAPLPAPPTPDTRSSVELAQAACPSGRCVGKQIPKLLGAGGATPLIPPSWTVPAWFIDPANSATCASNTNSGTAATCSGGCTGSTCPSGIGPIVSYQELSVHRWGCLGNPTACPRLRQDTTLTWLSSQTGSTDPVYLRPALEASNLFVVGTSLAVSGSPSVLANKTAKNRATPQKLQFSVTGVTLAANQIIVNTTHPAVAFTYLNIAGNTWSMTQPMTAIPVTPVPTLFGWASATEVDTWANADAVSVSTLTAVDLVDVEPVYTNMSAGLNNGLYLYRLSGLNPNANNLGATIFGTMVYPIESVFNRPVQVNAGFSGLEFGSGNCLYNAAVAGGSVTLGAQGGGTLYGFAGGALANQTAASGGLANTLLDEDIYLGGGSTVLGGGCQLGFVELDLAGTNLVANFGNVQINGPLGLGTPVIWGLGKYNATGQSRTSYPAGAGAGAALFLNTAGLNLNSIALACKGQPGAGGITIGCNLTLNPALLDTNAGATQGCTFLAGGASYCNFGL